MSRPFRINYAGAFYHVYHRGLERRKIYRDKQDYLTFLKSLEQAHIQFKVIIHAYCLMSNHYHLFIETPEGNLSRAMRHVNGVYTQKYNKRYFRVGPLFQGRFSSKLVDEQSYGLELSRYIHLNPVRAKMVKQASAYPYSSYRFYQGKEELFEGFERDWLLSQFAKKRSVAKRELEKFTRAGVSEEWRPEEHEFGRVLIGTKEFFKKIRDKYVLGEEDKEYSELREIKRTVDTNRLEGWIKSLGLGEKEQKKCYAYMLKRYTPLKLNEIGEKLGGLSYSGVSQLVSRLEKERQKNKSLSQALNALETKMSNVKT